MSSRLNPYITFANNAREAMTYYQEVLGGELAISTFGEYGAPEGVDPEGVMHALLTTPLSFTIMASDAALHEVTEDAGRISLSISGDDADALRGYFSALTEGGTVTVPLERQLWGDEFGMGSDRFGVTWMVNITQAG